MRGRDHTETDEERIINADSETSDYLKSILDAEWHRVRAEWAEDAE
jgi:hypothetical protein